MVLELDEERQGSKDAPLSQVRALLLEALMKAERDLLVARSEVQALCSRVGLLVRGQGFLDGVDGRQVWTAARTSCCHDTGQQNHGRRARIPEVD